jgi:hypothetical protein
VLRGELERTLPRLKSLSEAEKKSLEVMCDAMVGKLLHRPLTELKKSRSEPDGAQLLESVHRLFELSQDAAEPAARPASEPANIGAGAAPRPLVPSETPSGEGS